MLYHKAEKIAFVLPTRCGSTSTKHFLESIGFKQLMHPSLENDQHIKYRDAVAIFPNLKDYKKYGIFRDPLDRFFSTVNYLMTGKPLVSPEEFLEFFRRKENSYLNVFLQPQVEWLDHEDVNVIDFSNLEEGVKSAVKDIATHSSFPWLNDSKSGKLFADSYCKMMGINPDKYEAKIKEFVFDYYAADYSFQASNRIQ